MTLPAPDTLSPFHAGEQELQRRAGKRDRVEQFGRRAVRPFMPDQHRSFFEQLPFLVIGTVDESGWPWAGMLTGRPGFVRAPDDRRLEITPDRIAGDPAGDALRPGAALGGLGIELHSRRRNRVNGRVSALDGDRLTLAVDQSFGNCPQYVEARALHYPDTPAAPLRARPVGSLQDLDGLPARLIAEADMFFVASYVPAGRHPEREGVDVSHRGGRPGFVLVEGDRLTIPDFPGNNLFNTFGNFLLNPRAGLLFPDFRSGSLLQLIGTVELLDHTDPAIAGFRGAERGWRFTLREGTWLEAALPFRAEHGAPSPNSLLTDTWAEARARAEHAADRHRWRPLTVTRIVDESASIRSFHLAPADGSPVATFEAGQFLPLTLDIPGQPEPVQRTYTVSSAPGEDAYRISVKREVDGLVSRFLHDRIRPGDTLPAQAPRGGFHLDTTSHRPALLIGGGVGITPMIAMARHAAREGLRTRHLRPLTVLHAARTAADLAFTQEFRDLEAATEGGIRYLSALSGAGERSDFPGRIGADTLRALQPDPGGEVYLCGPGGFMQAVYDTLLELGIPDDRIHAEAFGPSALTRRGPASAPEAESATVHFARSSFAQGWTPEDGPLLDFAEAHGLSPNFSCRSGSCGSCATRITSGSVAYRSAPSAAPPEGTALICCAVPAAGSDALTLDL
ncbi:2Fe-2S iron-sulfur cluster-binding protein [Halovulum sp. GXIMD14794]